MALALVNPLAFSIWPSRATFFYRVIGVLGRGEMISYKCRLSAVRKNTVAWQPSPSMVAPGHETAVDPEHVLLILLIEAPALLS